MQIEHTSISTHVLDAAPVRQHIVEFYQEESQLAVNVAKFAEPGLLGNEAVVIIATPAHLQLFREKLSKRGLSVVALEQSGRLICLDAQEMLLRFTQNGQVFWTHFEATVGALVGELSKKYGKVRAYGEMVNLLWHRGSNCAALELEGFWNRLSFMYPFCLFCAYSYDPHGSAFNAQTIASICHTHSHALGSPQI